MVRNYRGESIISACYIECCALEGLSFYQVLQNVLIHNSFRHMRFTTFLKPFEIKEFKWFTSSLFSHQFIRDMNKINVLFREKKWFVNLSFNGTRIIIRSTSSFLYENRT